MKIIIDIPDYNLDEVQNGSIACGMILKAVKNGQVLPKGHGRLYDEKVLHDYWGEKYDLPHIPCVIEADKENKE